MSALISRRSMTLGIAAMPVAIGLSREARAVEAPVAAPADGHNGLTDGAQSIHQEIHFNADRQRVYEALTVAAKFDAVTRLSDAVTLMQQPGAKPTAISSVVGGPFTLFGGYITGINVELLPAERLVQAWRAGSFKVGEYSIVHFSLQADGAGTRVIFDHRGFPDGTGAHLAQGWYDHYWHPLAKFLSQA